MNIETLETAGFVTIEYPGSLRPRVQEAMASWKNFCALSPEDKAQISGGDRINDFGYMLRDGNGPQADHKEQFHVVRRNLKALHMKAEKISDRRAASFIDAIDVLLSESAELVEQFASDVGDYYGLRGFREEVMCSQDDWTFRYLHYFGGDILSNAHVDRGGGFTFHLDESDAGGEYLGFDGEWHAWPVSESQTIIFPSMGLQYRSKGRLKALCHRVVSTPNTATNGRYAMVAFIDFLKDCRYNEVKRLQEFPAGFNYGMPFDEFSLLFVPY